MDAVSYLTNLSRLCDFYTSIEMCGNSCPVFDYCNSGNDITEEDAKESVAAVEKWSKEHPFKTNGMRFLDDNREHIRTYHRWENDCKPYIEVHIEADWWDAEYKEER
jgi:hypothetical protein